MLSGAIADGAVLSGAIAEDAVTADKIADNAVLSGAIADGAVLSGAIADDAVTADKIADNAVLSGAIADGAVLSGAIAEDAVTADKIADGAVLPSLVVKRIAQAIITASDTLTYTSTRAGTSGNPINLRVSGQVYVDVSVIKEGPTFFDNSSDEVILTINGRNVGRGYFFLDEIDIGHSPGIFTGTLCLSFNTLFTFNSGSAHNLILAITSGKINTTYDNRIWVEELSEVVNLT